MLTHFSRYYPVFGSWRREKAWKPLYRGCAKLFSCSKIPGGLLFLQRSFRWYCAVECKSKGIPSLPWIGLSPWSDWVCGLCQSCTVKAVLSTDFSWATVKLWPITMQTGRRKCLPIESANSFLRISFDIIQVSNSLCAFLWQTFFRIWWWWNGTWLNCFWRLLNER